ncbi:MAG: histidine phosphatase family protein [Clostridia bacterium]|nr:histidine phosphatase family protein [Clostridia bacterium]
MLLYFIRHGDPIYDPDSLTELGRKQAAALAGRLGLYGLDEIYCSTSTRARQTAEPTCRKLGMEPVLLDWASENHAWREFAVPQPDGVSKNWVFHTETYVDLFNSPAVRALGDRWYEHEELRAFDFGRGIRRMQKEADGFLLSLGYRHDKEAGGYVAEAYNNKRVALFAHQGVGLLFLSCVMDIPYPYFSTHFDFGHSSFTVIEFDNRSVKCKSVFTYPKILQLSSDAHLYKEGLLTGYQNVIDV